MSLMMSPGLPAERRRELRELILKREHELADKRAREAGLTLRCLRAGDNSGEHRRCRGEMPGGVGCLCGCHDLDMSEPVREDSLA